MACGSKEEAGGVHLPAPRLRQAGKTRGQRAQRPPTAAAGIGHCRPLRHGSRSPPRLGRADPAGIESGSALLPQVRLRDEDLSRRGYERRRITFIERRQSAVIEKILRHWGLWEEGAGAKPLSTEPPFVFTCGGKPSAELLPLWKVECTSRDLDPRRVEHTLVYTDDATGLQVRCVAVEYRDFPTVEWTVHFKNTGTADTPLPAEMQALDFTLEHPGRGEFMLHHFTGSPCLPSDCEPFEASESSTHRLRRRMEGSARALSRAVLASLLSRRPRRYRLVAGVHPAGTCRPPHVPLTSR